MIFTARTHNVATELHVGVWLDVTSLSRGVSKGKPPQTRVLSTFRAQNLEMKPAGISGQIGGLSHHMNVHVSSLTGLQRHIVRSLHVWRKVKGALTSLLARSYSHVGKYESHMPMPLLIVFPRMQAQWRRAGIWLQTHALNVYGDEDAHVVQRRLNLTGPLRGRTCSHSADWNL